MPRWCTYLVNNKLSPLSRAATTGPTLQDVLLVSDADEHSSCLVAAIPASVARREEIQTAQTHDAVCSEIMTFCTKGWPGYMLHQPCLKPYWEKREHFTVTDGVLMMDDRFVVPKSLQLSMLEKIHTGHLGITKCQSRAQDSLWWPRMNKDIEETVTRCNICAKVRPQQKEPLMASSFPSRPWERVGSDLLEHSGRHYILVVDYYSRWIETRLLENPTSSSTINAMKSIFATHGIPDVLMSDNGPQYSSHEFAAFTKEYGFTHVTSSPRFPQSNGQAERAVRTLKGILAKGDDPYLGLLAYRSTALQNGSSPSELLMGRKLQTTLPTAPGQLQPPQGGDPQLQEKEAKYREKQADNYKRRHRATDLPVLAQGCDVWIRDMDRNGTIVSPTRDPRSYLVDTQQGTVRRNRSALLPLSSSTPTTPVRPQRQSTPQPLDPAPPKDCSTHEDVHSPPEAVTSTRKGRIIRQPKKLDL